jgi:lipopolysaccharide export system protein LptA/lipopolysaccharide export system protein LptC
VARSKLLRNQDAARYARWAAWAAFAIALIAAGTYGQRAFRMAQARSRQPAAIAATVEKQSNEFSYSQVENQRTLFTIRASRATQFKDENRALLQDVWISIYGREGNRNDNIHTRECNYEPKSGAVNCQGDVQIDLSSAAPATGKTPARHEKSVDASAAAPDQKIDQPIRITTKNLSFNRESGEAYTPEAVQFRFPEGQGHAVGVTYNSQNATVRLEHDVEIDMAASEKTDGLPVTATGGSLEIRRNERIVLLNAPAMVRQGSRELSAGKISIELDGDFRAQHAIAEDHPSVRSRTADGEFSASGERFEGFLNAGGSIDRIVADGKVDGTNRTKTGTDRFSMSHADFTMQGKQNLIKTMAATGDVVFDSQQGSDSRSLQTQSLLVKFGPGKQPDKARVKSAETLAPGTIVSKTATDSTELHAKKFVTQFNAAGQMEKLFGYSGVEIRRQVGSAAPQISSATELAATFAADGEWDTLDEKGDVTFQQADRQASAARARVARSTDTITMEGSPVLSDAVSRTTASNVTIQQKSGDIRATGGVLSTYTPAAQGSAHNTPIALGSGAGHISAQTLAGSTTSGHVIYTGRARLWQGDSVLQANQIEVWRDEKKLVATGNVVAVFPQASGPEVKTFASPSARSSTKVAGSGPSSPHAPTLWEIHAPTLTYWSDTGKAHLESGVTANSQEGSMESRTLDVFLTPAPAPGVPALATGAATALPPSGVRQLDHALALGGVTVRQGDRQGKAEQAEYTASDGKFVLSGGNPIITDASSDTTTGHSLTFFVANDTILIDSQAGSRTLTRHRVEK